jgi:hypothetical protein
MTKKTLNFDNENFNIPQNVKEILTDRQLLNIEKKAIFFSLNRFKKYRIIESYFLPGMKLYVLGHLYSKHKNFSNDKRCNFIPSKTNANSTEAALKRPYLIKKFDENKDGILSEAESKNLLDSITPNSFDKTEGQSELEKVIGVFRKSNNNKRIFDTQKVVVSTNEENALLTKMGFLGWGSLLLGTALLTLSSYLLLNIL